MKNAMVLDNDQLMRQAPSIFAQAASDKMSERYSFIPTIQVVDVLRNQGWMPVKAMQSRSRSENGKVEAKHLIRFRNEEKSLQVGDSFAELILVNSHNGSSSFQFMGGVYRLVCSNGMILGDTYASARVTHVGFTNDKVIDAQFKVLESVPAIAGSIDKMQAVQLVQSEQIALAEAALSIRYAETIEGQQVVKAPITSEQLLMTRRIEDRKTDLWSTFNAIQENLIRGGLRGVSVQTDEATGRIVSRRRTRTREVGSVNENVRLNRALWTLAERMAELKAAA